MNPASEVDLRGHHAWSDGYNGQTPFPRGTSVEPSTVANSPRSSSACLNVAPKSISRIPRDQGSLAALDQRAGAAGVRLALEPIHPVGLTIKGCVNSIAQALEIARSLLATDLVIDTFHSAWDPDIWRLTEIAGTKAAVVQVRNWYEPSPDEKPQRDLPSLGGMNLKDWQRALVASGYTGPIEFKMFDRHRRGRTVPDILNTGLHELREMLQ